MTKAAVDQPVWHKIRKSKVHGNGVFASDYIPEGARILEYLGEKLPRRNQIDGAGFSLTRRKRPVMPPSICLF